MDPGSVLASPECHANRTALTYWGLADPRGRFSSVHLGGLVSDCMVRQSRLFTKGEAGQRQQSRVQVSGRCGSFRGDETSRRQIIPKLSWLKRSSLSS